MNFESIFVVAFRINLLAFVSILRSIHQFSHQILSKTHCAKVVTAPSGVGAGKGGVPSSSRGRFLESGEFLGSDCSTRLIQAAGVGRL